VSGAGGPDPDAKRDRKLAALAVIAKLAVSALVLASGFVAVSDDDFARVVIAQRFAQAPALDPTGTSWLPLPFWLYGTAFAAFGPDLAVARALGVLLGALSILAVFQAARWLGAGRLGALAGALAAATLPWSAWLGAATLPEAPTAGLLVLGMASLGSEDVRRRTIGAGAVALACLARYEAWPVAAAFAAFTALDARRRSPALFGAAGLGVLPIGLWLLHGAVRHDDALFFWKRVAGYKQALGGTGGTALRALDPFLELFASAPWVWLASPVLFVVGRQAPESLAPLRRYLRGAVSCLLLVSFLSIGELGGGAPTHHAERVLLPVWYFACIAMGHALEAVTRERRREPLFWGGVTLVALLHLASGRVAGPRDFARRDAELDIGDAARRVGAPALVVDTPDFGYFAVLAAFGRPLGSEPLDDRDPRRARPKDAFRSPDALRKRLGEPAAWLVATREHGAVAAALGLVHAENARFVLVEPKR